MATRVGWKLVTEREGQQAAWGRPCVHQALEGAGAEPKPYSPLDFLTFAEGHCCPECPLQAEHRRCTQRPRMREVFWPGYPTALGHTHPPSKPHRSLVQDHQLSITGQCLKLCKN